MIGLILLYCFVEQVFCLNNGIVQSALKQSVQHQQYLPEVGFPLTLMTRRPTKTKSPLNALNRS